MSDTPGLIPARTGSITVPDKNRRPLAGRPLIAHAVETARESGVNTETVFGFADSLMRSRLEIAA